MADEISQKLSSIQAQLAKLQTDYTSMATAMYDMFFNTEAKDVTLRLYDDKGRLVAAFNTCEIHLYLNFLHNCILTWFHRYHTIDALLFQT